MLIPDKIFWLILLIVLILLGVGIREGMSHETHLSDIGPQTNVTIKPCPILSGYIVTSDQRECYLVYKQTDLAHSAMHVQDIPLNRDGECVCLTLED